MPSVVTYDNQRRDVGVAELDDAGGIAGGAQRPAPCSRGSTTTSRPVSTLVVSPHISADEYLRLDIELEVSSNFQERFGGRRTASRRASATSSIRPLRCPIEHTVVMGGLIGEDETIGRVRRFRCWATSRSLGYLFKHKTRRKVKRNLFVFVTPHILRQHESVDFDGAAQVRRGSRR